jgi:hypothetical protein
MEYQILNKKKNLSPNNLKFGSSRSLQDYKRSIGNVPPHKVIVIVCEGKVTEPCYFNSIRQSLRLPTINIKIVPGKIDPLSIVNTGINEKNDLDDPDDEVWCVFDVENLINNPSFDEAVRLAKRENLYLAISNPAFEYWYLIHFECTNRPFPSAANLIKRLKKHIPFYEKNQIMFPLLQERTNDALNNVKMLSKQSDISWEEFPNPSTGVHKIILTINEIYKNKYGGIHISK